MSTLLNSNIWEIFEIYQNSSELQKIIIIDVIEDLLRLVNHNRPIKTPEMILIQPMIDDLSICITQSSKEIQEELWKIFQESIYPLEDWESIVTFIYQKDRIHYSSKIRSYFMGIGDHEQKEIWNLRKMIIQNFLSYKIIRKVDVSDSPLSKLFQWYDNETIIRDKNNKVIEIKKELIFDKNDESFNFLESTFWEDEIEKALYAFINLEWDTFVFIRDDLNQLLETITGESILKVMSYSPNNHRLYFWNDYLTFKKWDLPSQILEEIFKEQDISIWITYEELYKNTEEISELWKDYYNGWLERYKNSIKWINRRIRCSFPEISTFLESRKTAIYRTI